MLLSLCVAQPASAIDNDRESAADAVWSAIVAVVPAAKVRGRTVETQCGGGGPRYGCSWWVIKSPRERLALTAAENTSDFMLRRGEGNAHTRTPRRVVGSGKATATWGCKLVRVGRRLVNVCSFSVSLS